MTQGVTIGLPPCWAVLRIGTGQTSEVRVGDSVADDGPRVAVAIDHPVMRSLVVELLARKLGCVIVEDHAGNRTIDLTRMDVELVVVDGAAFAAASADALPDEAPAVIVLGPEPDPGYRDYALARGAKAWLAREHIARELLIESRRLLNIDPQGSNGRSPAGRNAGNLPDAESEGGP